MVVIEYRIVVPFTLEEFHRGLRYLDGRQRKEIASTSANGEQIDTVEHRAFTNLDQVPKIIQDKGRIPNRGILCRNGTFTENRLYLGTRFPAWLRALVPTKALYVREKYYNCYPYSFCSYHSELFSEGLDFTIESLHVENDVGRSENIYADCSEVEKREMKLQIVDLTKPVESTAGVFQGDPTAPENVVDGRGPLPKSQEPIGKYWFDIWIEEYKTKRSEFLKAKQNEKIEESGKKKNTPSSSVRGFANRFFQKNTDPHHDAPEGNADLILLSQRINDSASSSSGETTSMMMNDLAKKNFNKYMERHSAPPHLCIYKRSKVHITGGLPFASAVEEAAQNSTVRDLAVHSFRNLFVWLPEWQALGHDAITKYLSEVGGAV